MNHSMTLKSLLLIRCYFCENLQAELKSFQKRKFNEQTIIVQKLVEIRFMSSSVFHKFCNHFDNIFNSF